MSHPTPDVPDRRPAASDEGGPSASAVPDRRRVSTRLLISGLLVLTLAAGVLVAVLGGARSPADAVPSPSANGTAQVAIVGSVTAEGISATFHGTGSLDLLHGAAQLALTANAVGQQFTAKLVLAGGSVYVSTPLLGHLPPGKSWVSLAVASPGSTAPGLVR